MMGCAMNEREVDGLTRQWILVWNDGDPATLPLAPDFQHTSPYGHIEGRERYLDWVLPLATKNVAKLTIEDVLVSGNQSVVRYQNRLASGETMRACDWLTFSNGELTQVRSYYERPDASKSAYGNDG
jgi:ketosteroid isomerase-like protein